MKKELRQTFTRAQIQNAQNIMKKERKRQGGRAKKLKRNNKSLKYLQ